MQKKARRQQAKRLLKEKKESERNKVLKSEVIKYKKKLSAQNAHTPQRAYDVVSTSKCG